MRYSVAEQFTTTPGLRYRIQGEYSGEEFREEHLEKLFETYCQTNEPVEIDLDGAFGYPTSFLEEAFGGLARNHSPESVQSAFTFVSDEFPSAVEEIIDDIKKANNPDRRK